MKTTIREVRMSDAMAVYLPTDHSSLVLEFLDAVKALDGSIDVVRTEILKLIDWYGQSGLRIEESVNAQGFCIRLIDNNHNEDN